MPTADLESVIISKELSWWESPYPSSSLQMLHRSRAMYVISSYTQRSILSQVLRQRPTDQLPLSLKQKPAELLSRRQLHHRSERHDQLRTREAGARRRQEVAHSLPILIVHDGILATFDAKDHGEGHAVDSVPVQVEERSGAMELVQCEVEVGDVLGDGDDIYALAKTAADATTFV